MVVVYHGLRSKVTRCAGAVQPKLTQRRPQPSFASAWLTRFENAYLAVLPLVQLYVSVIHPTLFPTVASPGHSTTRAVIRFIAPRTSKRFGLGDPSSSSLEFLPLMLVSVTTAIGLIWAWLRLSYAFLLR